MTQPVTYDDIGGERRAILHDAPRGDRHGELYCTLWRNTGSGWQAHSTGSYQELEPEQRRLRGQGHGALIELPRLLN